MKPLVYVAGPYTHPDPITNTRDAFLIADRLLASELVTPLVPHGTMLWHFLSPRPVEDWYAYDLELLARCDALLRLPGASVGADREVEYAMTLRLWLFTDVESVLAWAERQYEPTSRAEGKGD